MRAQVSTVAVAVLVATTVTACGSSSKPQTITTPPQAPAKGPGVGKPPVTIGTKNFTEEFVLGQLYAQALRAQGFTVNLKSNIGASETIDRSLVSGQIDGYPEYTGTIRSAVAHNATRPASAASGYATAKQFEEGRGMTLLDMAAATDTDVIVTTPAYAHAHELKSLADMTRLGASATLGAAPEFKTRSNGLVGLERDYGVTRLAFKPLPIAMRYQALAGGQVQLIAAFTTDGQLSQGGYTLLADPRNIFGFQNVTFVISKRALAREGPAFARTINAVTAKLSTQALRVMNAAVDLDGQRPDAVARQFLGANGLI